MRTKGWKVAIINPEGTIVEEFEMGEVTPEEAEDISYVAPEISLWPDGSVSLDHGGFEHAVQWHLRKAREID